MLRYPVVHLRRAILKKTNEEEKLSNKDPFRGSKEGWDNLVGGLVKNPTKNKDGFDDGTAGGRPKDDRPRYRKLEALPPAERNTEEKKMTGTPVNATPAPRPQQDSDKESCPLCGYSKQKETRFTGRDGREVVSRLLVCKACSDRFKQYQEGVRMGNIKFLIANPTAPEPTGPMDKFHWVLGQIDLEKFKAEVQAAETAYRAKYDETVVKVLAGRGYLVGSPEWKGVATSRPANLQFTKTAWDNGNGNGPLLQTALEKSLGDMRFTMKRMSNRLEAATRVKAELEAELAKNAAATPTPPATLAVATTESVAPAQAVDAPTPVAADAAPATPAAEKKTADNGSTPPPVDVKPSAKPRKGK